jgi:hypothetical protein
MFFLRLALYTCAFYLGVAFVLEAAVLAFTYWKGGFGISFSGRGAIAVFAGFWGVIWLLSFLLAFRMVFQNVWARFVG